MSDDDRKKGVEKLVRTLFGSNTETADRVVRAVVGGPKPDPVLVPLGVRTQPKPEDR